MHLKKLVTRNFRLWENFEIEFNPEVTVLIGPNYTGKSSVIEAMLFFRDTLRSGSVNSSLAGCGKTEVSQSII
jgi:recombinational DNA repair ATPase RecF